MKTATMDKMRTMNGVKMNEVIETVEPYIIEIITEGEQRDPEIDGINV